MNRVIIVEGITDKQRLLQLLNEPVAITCTFGTLGPDKLEELIVKELLFRFANGVEALVDICAIINR